MEGGSYRAGVDTSTGSGSGGEGGTSSPPTLRGLLRASADYLSGSSSTVSTEATADTRLTGSLTPSTSPPVRRSASARVMTSSEPLMRSVALDTSSEVDQPPSDKDFAQRLEVLSLRRCDRVDERRKKKLEAALPGCLVLVGEGEVAPRQTGSGVSSSVAVDAAADAGSGTATGTPPASPRRLPLAIPPLELHGGTSLVSLVRTGSLQVSASVFFAEFSTLQSSRLRLVRTDAADASGVICLGDPPRAFCGGQLGLAPANAGVLPQLSAPPAEVEPTTSSDEEDELDGGDGGDGLGSLSSSISSRPPRRRAPLLPSLVTCTARRASLHLFHPRTLESMRSTRTWGRRLTRCRTRTRRTKRMRRMARMARKP